MSSCRDSCHAPLPPANLVILVGCDSSELSAREDEGLSGLPVQVVDVIRLHNVQPRLVPVHAVHNDLCNEWGVSALAGRMLERGELTCPCLSSWLFVSFSL